MINPASYDITVQQRASFSLAFVLKDGTGTPLNLTGYSISSQIWNSTLQVEFLPFTFAWVDQDAGSFTLTLTPEQTTTLISNGVWDMLVTNPDGSEDYWVRGNAFVVPGATRPGD